MKQSRVRLNFTSNTTTINLARLQYPSNLTKVDMRNKTFFDISSADDTIIIYVGTVSKTTTYANMTWSATPASVTVQATRTPLAQQHLGEAAVIASKPTDESERIGLDAYDLF